MNWEDERYVRLYVRDTGDWCALSWDAQALLMHLLRKADRSGIVQLGKRGRANLPAMLGHGNETARIDSALSELVLDGCVELRGDNLLVIPNFTKAQEAKQSDRRRQEESRGKRLAEAMAQPVSGITYASHAVTPSHAVSHHVTPAVPSVPSFRAEPAEPELPLRGFRSVETAAPQQLALVGDRAKSEKPARAKRAPKAAAEDTVAGRLVWSAYEAAYEARYQRLPKRNGWVHNDLQKLIKNVGADDAARIAGYYPTTNHQFYVKNWHAFRFMVTDYEKLLGEIETGRVVTETTARANERTVSNPGLAYVAELEAELAAERAKENGR